ncbi:MAG: EpsI family protein [Pirellulales bacterium]|nr:EpsI family protein [Pirellulales bacterium]
MRIRTRVAILTGTLGVALAAKCALFGYLQAAGPLPAVPLLRPLQEFPTALGRWTSRDEPVTDPQLLDNDDRLSRVFFCRNHRQVFRVWMSYSGSGKDRGHNPEVCMRAGGMSENPRGRAAFSVAGHPEPIQQYLFGRQGEVGGVLVFYWYYTLTPPQDASSSPLQRAYQRCQRRASSLTVEVFSPMAAEQDVASAREFVCLLDQSLQALLPRGVVRGSKRMPVFLINEGGPRPP